MKFRAAAKGRRLFFLAAVCLLSALFLSPAVEASRGLPAALAPALTAPATPDQVLESELSDPTERLRLFDDFRLPPRPLELVEARKTASGSSSYKLGLNVWQTGDLSQECSGLSFQGLWTDPVTGISYARNRWYDARTASWLSEDPKGAVDSPNLYAFVGWGPHARTDPMGLCWLTGDNLSCREAMGAIGEGLLDTGHDLWNVASLGTLERVENQENLGTWTGVGESIFHGARGVSNAASFGLQDAIYETQMEDGPGLKSIGMGVSKAAYDLLPMEEVRVLVQEGDQLDGGQKLSVVMTGISKTAGLGAAAVGGAEMVSQVRQSGSLHATRQVMKAQRTGGGIKKRGDAGEAALKDILGDGDGVSFQKTITSESGRPLRHNGRGRRLDAAEEVPGASPVGYEVKNGFLKRLDRGQFEWDVNAVEAGYLSDYNYVLMRGASPGVLASLNGAGFGVLNFGALMPNSAIWNVMSIKFGIVPAMQREIP